VIRRARVWALATALALALAACASGSGGSSGTSGPSPSAAPRPSSTATLSVLSPKNGSVVHGSTVDLRLRLRGAKIVQATSSVLRPDEGHVHVVLDGQLISMNYRLDDVLHDVSPGRHLLQAEFVANDHAPFDPRVIAVTSFVVKA
jgi:hypothetical protein